MNRDDLKTILADQRKERSNIFAHDHIVEREQIIFWKDISEGSLIKVIMGARRSGKTIFSHLLLRGKEFGFVNFDDERLAYLDRDGLNDLLEGLYEIYGKLDILFLDEIQNVKGWELFVNRLQRKGLNVYITGSNANLLGKELSTHLTGRFIQMELLPFSFREFLLWRHCQEDGMTTEGRATIKKHLGEYLEIGGFPEVVRNPEIRSIYLSNLYSAIITKDILSRHNIRYVKTFRELATNLISNYSNYITYNKLKNIHGLKSVHTVKNYVDMLAEAYLIFTLEKYSPKAKEVVNSPKKVYAVDTGLTAALALSPTPNRGRIIENLVFLELVRWRSLDPLLELYYWKDYQQHEVDFVIKRGTEVIRLMQVTHVSGMEELDKRELRSLKKGSELLGCNDLWVITWDLEGEHEMDGKTVTLVPLWKWLLVPPMARVPQHTAPPSPDTMDRG